MADARPVDIGGSGPGGGSSGPSVSNIFDIFADGELPYGGIRARYGAADGGWSARGIQSVPGVQASVFLPISGTPGAGWRFTFEETLEIGAAGNAWRLLRFPRSPIIPAVAASLQWEYRPARYITITATTAGTVGNSYAMNAFILGSTGVVSYIRSNAQGPRFDVRVIPSTTVADVIAGANAAYSDVVFSPGTGYIATDTLTNQLLGPGGSGYARFSRGTNEVPGQTILATVHSFPSTTFTLRIAATDTLADIRSEIISYLISEGVVLSTVGVVDEATDTFDVPAVDPGLNFAGGVNVVPFGVSIDEASKVIDATYDAGTNTLAELLAAMATAGIQPEYRGSVDGTESPEAVGWIRTLGPITAAGATTGTGPATPALTGAQIKQKYEANANTNAFTNAEQTKLGGIETDSTADQTGAEIKTAYEGESDTNVYSNAEKTKLGSAVTLAKILSGAGIAIDRTAPGQITIGADIPVVSLGVPTAVEAKGLTFAKPAGYPTTGRYPKGTLISFELRAFGAVATSSAAISIFIGTDKYNFYDTGTGSIYYSSLFTDTEYLVVSQGSTTLQLIAPTRPRGFLVKAAYEGESDTNAFTNALKTKLEGIATAATAVSIVQVLAKIFAGTGININRAVGGQITITNTVTGGGGGGGGTDDVVTTAAFDEGTQTVTFTTTTGGTVTLNLGGFITAAELTTALTPYTKADGSVAFTAVVAGVTPTDDVHLSTKKYVDDADVLKASLAGATFTGAVKGLAPADNSDFVTLEYFSTHRNAVPILDDLYFGISDDDIPLGSELTVEGVASAGPIAAYLGNKHLLIARLATKADLRSVRFSSDSSGNNQIGAFTKFATPVIPDGATADYNVWVSNQAVTNTALLLITVG